MIRLLQFIQKQTKNYSKKKDIQNENEFVYCLQIDPRYQSRVIFSGKIFLFGSW